jgi:hypothetical protein
MHLHLSSLVQNGQTLREQSPLVHELVPLANLRNALCCSHDGYGENSGIAGTKIAGTKELVAPTSI